MISVGPMIGIYGWSGQAWAVLDELRKIVVSGLEQRGEGQGVRQQARLEQNDRLPFSFRVCSIFVILALRGWSKLKSGSPG